ncbi:hypothetical protein APHACPA_0855 [Rickettsia amblyommatis str. Ac/Pa]|uniref:Uncharacterized protein n=1 Tax=Rickettsia amblyommatis str. Ac/Pa TaxID=1359164 RepID=A0A0F3N4K7_RICAM|nr:hypothetical protein APHACPA_0855 [Rickettsia amblyommatis str. Ac/Pa]
MPDSVRKASDVIPAKAGIQAKKILIAKIFLLCCFTFKVKSLKSFKVLDSCFRRNDIKSATQQ